MSGIHEKSIIRYHEETKHSFHQYARSPGYMDWHNQPNPFRSYRGTREIALPFLSADPDVSHMGLFNRDGKKVKPFTLKTIAGFLELSLALSAWKIVPGSKWSLRINPSSGNLHPTEAHLVLGQVENLISGVYHYNPLLHALERRIELPSSVVVELGKFFQTDFCLVGLSSIFWRESWKYGERAFRYCNHDAGHALACLSFSANLMGWTVRVLTPFADSTIRTLLGFDRVEWIPLEEEHPDMMCIIHPTGHLCEQQIPSADLLKRFASLPVHGKPNRLSHSQVKWDNIYQAAVFTDKPETSPMDVCLGKEPYITDMAGPDTAARIIRKRRSAVSFDPEGTLDKIQFFSILDKTLPRKHHAPFDAELMPPEVDLVLFVHKVNGLPQGLYFLDRTGNGMQNLKHRFRSEFLWEETEHAIHLYLLKTGDFRRLAMRISCHQEIAGSSVFSLGMIARFSEVVAETPWRYRHLFWETGMIGQVLYLEAEAHGVRGTGIGCFFDDAVHDILGLKDNAWQSLYHFTIGVPVEDDRLTSIAPYEHLTEKRP